MIKKALDLFIELKRKSGREEEAKMLKENAAYEFIAKKRLLSNILLCVFVIIVLAGAAGRSRSNTDLTKQNPEVASQMREQILNNWLNKPEIARQMKQKDPAAYERFRKQWDLPDIDK